MSSNLTKHINVKKEEVRKEIEEALTFTKICRKVLWSGDAGGMPRLGRLGWQ